MAKPELCFGSVYHHRLRPVSNAFSYGVYYLRLPLRSMSRNPVTPALFSRNGLNLLSICDRNYGNGKQALLECIDSILAKAGIHDARARSGYRLFPVCLATFSIRCPSGFATAPTAHCGRSCAKSATPSEKSIATCSKTKVAFRTVRYSQRQKYFTFPRFALVEGNYQFQFRNLHADPETPVTLRASILPVSIITTAQVRFLLRISKANLEI